MRCIFKRVFLPLCWLLFFLGGFLAWAQSSGDGQLYLLGIKAYKDGLWELASQQFEQYLSKYPEGTEAAQVRFLQAEALFQQQQYWPAAILCQEFIRLYPDHELLDKVWYRLGVCNYRLGKYKEAEAAYQKLQQYPRNYLTDKALLGLAESRYAQAKYKSAQEIYRQVVAQVPANPYRDAALYGLGWSSLKLDEYKQAVTSFNQFINDYPDKPLASEARSQLAQAYFAQKDYSEAAAAYAEFIGQNPDYKQLDQALFNCAYAHYKAGNYSRAIIFFERLLKTTKAYSPAEALFYMAESQYALNQYQQALGSYQKLYRDYAKSKLAPAAVYNIGLCYLELNQPDKGEEIFEKLIETYPKHELAKMGWMQLGRLKFKSKDYVGAEEAYAKAAASTDRQLAAEAGYWRGECLGQQGLIDQALQAFLKLPLQSDDKSQWVNLARYQAGQIYKQQQKKLAAQKLFLSVVQNSKDKQLVQMAKQNLEDLLAISSTDAK
jgi:TolA-binding protein